MKMGEVVVGAAGAGTGTQGDDDDQQYPATSISGRQQKTTI